MTTEPHSLSVSGLDVAVVPKPIRNLHLGVYPPDGRVRVAVPMAGSDAAVRVAVIGKLRWIRRQQAAFAAQPRETEREMVSGESHYFVEGVSAWQAAKGKSGRTPVGVVVGEGEPRESARAKRARRGEASHRVVVSYRRR